MRYTKAHVLATVDANLAIHHNDKPQFEKRVAIHSVAPARSAPRSSIRIRYDDSW